MRIFFVIMSFTSGGAEVLVRNLALRLVQQGHDCTVVAVSRATALGNSASFEAEYVRALNAGGVGTVVLMRRARRNVVLGAIRLRQELKKFKPDVVHLHAPRGLLFWCLTGLRIPAVYTHHNVVLNFPRRLFRLFDLRVRSYVAVGEACRIALERLVRRPVELIYNGVPPAASPAAPKVLPRHPTILSVGNLTSQKDYGTLVQAAKSVHLHLARENRTVRFLIAGEGEQRAQLAHMIEGTGMGEVVRLLGARTDVERLMKSATLLVNSSVYEGLPIALLEALQAGLPIVATDVGGNHEIVEEGSNGVLVNPEQSDELAAAILRLLSDCNLYSRLAHGARQRASAFELRACAEKHVQLYKRLAPGK